MLQKFDQPNNMDNDPSARNREPTDNEENRDREEYPDTFTLDDEFDNQEFSALNRQLDQLQSALDTLESRNADIHQELLELLQSNREVRRVIVEEMANENVLSGNNSGDSAAEGSDTNQGTNKAESGDTLTNIINGVASAAISEVESSKDKNCSQPNVISSLNVGSKK